MASSQVLSIQPVVMLRCGPVLKLPCICLEVSSFMLPPQAAAPTLKCVHGEVAGNVDAFGACIASNAKRRLSAGKGYIHVTSVITGIACSHLVIQSTVDVEVVWLGCSISAVL